MSEPDWLTWARELQAIAQTGSAFTRDPYDRQRYEALRVLASRIMEARTGIAAGRFDALFAAERGYATPKVGVRGAVFDAQGRLLLVREVVDDGRWTLPGGWAESNLTAAENVVKEVREESGYEVRVRKLAAVWDRGRQGHPPGLFSVYRFFFICDLIGGDARPSLETSEVGWFAEDDLPADLSVNRVLPRQLRRMFAHARDDGLPTEFD
ncbi:NUDIX hydrolase [Rhodopila sp.]|jgi:ADP-ribose pyrophosphatase YjhB (NUDIX family)|uniref:NUDIX hydrolase n=1 Tax=Rhodopila sp. TaxID=2480087 RepID=UPI002C881546|nr:NUDIX hydrolase [Rhodopila sp.]HVZ09237.1 NUDIX hydrolase [Rhodopila sp.]